MPMIDAILSNQQTAAPTNVTTDDPVTQQKHAADPSTSGFTHTPLSLVTVIGGFFLLIYLLHVVERKFA